MIGEVVGIARPGRQALRLTVLSHNQSSTRQELGKLDQLRDGNREEIFTCYNYLLSCFFFRFSAI